MAATNGSATKAATISQLMNKNVMGGVVGVSADFSLTNTRSTRARTPAVSATTGCGAPRHICAAVVVAQAILHRIQPCLAFTGDQEIGHAGFQLDRACVPRSVSHRTLECRLHRQRRARVRRPTAQGRISTAELAAGEPLVRHSIERRSETLECDRSHARFVVNELCCLTSRKVA